MITWLSRNRSCLLIVRTIKLSRHQVCMRIFCIKEGLPSKYFLVHLERSKTTDAYTLLQV